MNQWVYKMMWQDRVTWLKHALALILTLICLLIFVDVMNEYMNQIAASAYSALESPPKTATNRFNNSLIIMCDESLIRYCNDHFKAWALASKLPLSLLHKHTMKIMIIFLHNETSQSHNHRHISSKWKLTESWSCFSLGNIRLNYSTASSIYFLVDNTM